MGHSLFGLWDEYFDTEAPRETGADCDSTAPNVAADETEAKTWWGHLVGGVDPFYYEYRDTLLDHGLWATKEPFDFESGLTIGYFPMACGVKPTEYSVMAWRRPQEGAIPVFGSVNRLRATQVLQLWTGT
jgi:hypothetical protein